MADDPSWKPIQIIGSTPDRDGPLPVGQVEQVTGLEQRPCMMCQSFEKDDARLRAHFIAKGVPPDPDGTVASPIAKDFPGRKPMRIDLRDFGFCRLLTMPVDILATCERWSPTKTVSDFQRKFRSSR